MTRKKRTTKSNAPFGRVRTITDEPILPDELEAQEDDPFRFALQEFGEEESLTLHVYRYDPMTGKARYAKSVPFQRELHGLEWLQRMFGAGDYLLRFYDSEGKSKNRRVSIDDDPTMRRREEPASSSSTTGRDELVTVLREQNQLLLSAFVKGGGASSSSPAENPLLTKILDVVLPQAFAKPDMTQALLSTFEKGIEVAMEAKGDSEGGMAGVLRGLARELAPVIREYAAAQARRPPAPVPMPMMIPPGAPAPPAPAPPSSSPTSSPPSPNPPSSPPPAEASGPMLVEGTIRLGAGLIEQAWRAKETADDVAGWILGEIPANYHEHLSALTYDRVLEIEPRYGNIERAWLEQVLSTLHSEAAGIEVDDGSPTNAP